MAISTHVLDTRHGRPAAGVSVSLARAAGEAWHAFGAGITDADGRCRTLTPAGAAEPGRYRLRFETGAYFSAAGEPTFFPHVDVVFDVAPGAAHVHVPLLLSPFAYSTYRGS